METNIETVEAITVRPHGHGTDEAIVEMNGVRIIADWADIDGSDNITFYRENVSVAHVKVNGAPLEVPNMVRRAVKFGETAEWP